MESLFFNFRLIGTRMTRIQRIFAEYIYESKLSYFIEMDSSVAIRSISVIRDPILYLI